MKRCLSLLLLFFLLTGCTSAPETSSEGPDEPAVPAGPSISTTEPSTSPEEVPDPRRETIDRLPEKERLTILLRYFKGLTQERAARVLGVSQVQVSRLERRGLERLRQSFAE